MDKINNNENIQDLYNINVIYSCYFSILESQNNEIKHYLNV